MNPGHRTGTAQRKSKALGFTLIEISVTVAVIGVLAAAAWPSQLASLQRARRIDAIAALTRVQIAQEQYRARYGVYSAQLTALTGASAARSPEGLYQLAVLDASGENVTLSARARDDGPQRSDTDCRELTLRLSQGLADIGPSGRCWNR